MVGTGRGAQLGIIIKGPEVLESTRMVDTIVLDKTGTVTTGAMSLVGVHPAPGTDAGELLRLGGSLEHASEHPIAAAIAAGAAAAGYELAAVEDSQSARGLGVTRHGRRARRGRRATYASSPNTASTSTASCVARLRRRRGGRADARSSSAGTANSAACVVVADTVKPTSADGGRPGCAPSGCARCW